MEFSLAILNLRVTMALYQVYYVSSSDTDISTLCNEFLAYFPLLFVELYNEVKNREVTSVIGPASLDESL